MKNRIFISLLAAVLFGTALVTLYNFASSPTDENVFTNAPGKLMFAEPLEIPADSVSIQEGDILVAVNGIKSKVRTIEEIRRAIAQIPRDSVVALEVNQSKRMKYGKYRVRASVLQAVPFVPIDSTVLVIGVTPGGASDRAGMQIGDLITRINGQTFSTDQEADRILRRAQSGGSFTYEVLRGRSRLTLNVVLAAFGIPLANLIFSLAGFVYLGIGAFIALKRPQLIAARLLGIGLLLLGFVMAVWMIRRDPDPTLFVIFRAGGIAAAIFFGIAVYWQSSMYFPSEREELLSKRWITRGNYGLAGLVTVVSVVLGARGLLDKEMGLIFIPILIMIPVLFNIIVRSRHVKFRTQQYLTQRELLTRTSTTAGMTCAFIAVGFTLASRTDLMGFIAIPLVFIPLSLLYTIGRYRLLDMNLRIRRNVQYTMVSIVWGLFCTVLAVAVLSVVLSAQVHVPNVAIHGTSIEVGDIGLPGQAGGPTERFLFMVVAVGLWFVLWKMRKGGQGLIDKRYYRTRYDYRRALSELSEMLATKLSMADLGRGIVEKIVQLMQLKRAGVFFFRDDAVCCCREAYGLEAGTWESFCTRDERALVKAVAEFEGEFTVDYLPEALKNEFRALDFRYVIPIRSKEHLIGALVLGEKLSEATFSQEDLDFLSSAARQASVSIENAFLYEELAEQERMKHELEIARRIQMASLPQRTPVVKGLDVAGQSRPALEVGGDFFDYLNGSENAMTVVVGDVSGKGTSAALYMSKVQGILRSLHGFTKSPAELFIRTNRLLSDDLEKSSFITALGAAFDTTNRSALIARAGHLPLYRYCPATGSVEKVTTRGLGLGLDNGGIFATELEERALPYASGDIMAFATDGIIEARNEQLEEFGEERLLSLIQCHADLSASDIRARILEAVNAFAGSVPQHDDQTLVVVKVT
jgi:serine phosphatase RsbU (regulator of sigma subunit)